MSMSAWLLILAVALLALGVLRFDVLLARWRELVSHTPPAGQVPPAPPGNEPTPHHTAAHPHAAPSAKPGFHRSGRRH